MRYLTQKMTDRPARFACGKEDTDTFDAFRLRFITCTRLKRAFSLKASIHENNFESISFDCICTYHK